VLQRMMDARDKLLATLWAKRKAGLPIQHAGGGGDPGLHRREGDRRRQRAPAGRLDLHQPAEQGHAAGERSDDHLRHHPGRPLGRRIFLSELQAPTPYNTYAIERLPPTPIANPGRAALAAVLDPPETDYLFFVADGSGGHAFAATYEEHQRNVEKWRAWRARTGK
jgi:UPF0755 protein